MNKLYSTLLLLGLTSFAGSASAADSNWYVGLAVGQSSYAQMKPNAAVLSQGFTQEGLPNTYTVSDSGNGYDLVAGYQFFRYLAVEGGYTDFGAVSADYQIHLTPSGAAHVGIHATGETLFAVGILPVSDRFSVFGKVGLLAYSQDFTANVGVTGGGSKVLPTASDTGTTPAIGAGASFAFNDRFGLRLGFTRFHAVGDANNTGEGTIDLSYLELMVHF